MYNYCGMELARGRPALDHVDSMGESKYDKERVNS